MKIGSFFLILLAALVALGYLLSDSLHLREDISNQQIEIERLTQVVQQAEREKQNALIALQNVGQELQSCQSQVQKSDQIINRLINENTSLKEQNHQLVNSAKPSNAGNLSVQHEIETVQAAAFGLIASIILGLGSMVVMGLKRLRKQFLCEGRTVNIGQYVYLTDVEIKELVQRRRNKSKSST